MLIVALVLALAAPAAGQGSRNAQAEAGWLALKQGDANGAAAAFDEALKQSPRDATLHLGAGVAAHLLGRDGDAVDSLKRALALNPKLTAASQLLGEVEYQQGHLDAAIQRYEEALKLAPDGGAAMRARLEEWRREAAVHAGLTTTGNARFTVVFDGRSDNALAAHAVGVLDRAFPRIAERIGAYPPSRIEITLYTEAQFRDITHMPAWSIGAFDGKVRIPVRGAAQDTDQFDRVLVHELTHAIVHGLAPRGVPGWLQEGLATYFEPRDVALAQRRVQAAGVVIPLSQLQESFGRLTEAQAKLAYAESLIAADLLVRSVGPRLAELLRALARGESFNQALGQAGLAPSDFESQFNSRLRP